MYISYSILIICKCEGSIFKDCGLNMAEQGIHSIHLSFPPYHSFIDTIKLSNGIKDKVHIYNIKILLKKIQHFY